MTRALQVLVMLFVSTVTPSGQGASPGDLAGEWLLTVERFGEPDYQRLTVTVRGAQLTFEAPGTGWLLDGTLQDGRIELRRRG
jgi:hypothetical protein